MKKINFIIIVVSNIITMSLTLLFYVNKDMFKQDVIFKNKNYIDPNELDSIKVKVLKGDTNAYSDLSVYHIENSKEGILFWSLMMSNKYKYAPAYFDVFLVLLYPNENDIFSIENLDNDTRLLALNYLVKGAEKNEPNSIGVLSKYVAMNKYVIFKDNHYIIKGNR